MANETDPHSNPANPQPPKAPEHHAARKGHQPPTDKDAYKTISPEQLKRMPNPDETING